MPDESHEEILARLRDRYLESVNGKADALALLLCRCVTEQDDKHSWADALLSDAASSPPGTTSAPRVNAAGESALTQATRQAHSMVGSGASYGFPGITTRARVIEETLRALPEEPAERRTT